MDTIRIKPVDGKSLPFETSPRRRVTAEVTVPNTAYYRRAVARGDVELCAEPKAKAEKPADKTA